MGHHGAKLLAALLLVIVAGCGSGMLIPVPEGTVVRHGDIVEGTGTVRFYELEGGFYAIRGDDEENYDPINLPDAFERDGLPVRFRARIREDMGSFHMVGPMVELLMIEGR